jgi:energy-converting hydrogenase A subunit D
VIGMEFLVSVIAMALMVIGAFGIIFMKKPLDKVIMFSILDAGFVLVIVLFKYLDVALFAALAGPLSTLVFILSIVKIKEIREKKLESGDVNA